jgi:protein phosphatase
VSAVTVAGVQLSVAALTHVGLKRLANEDAFMADGPAFVVADGMGGYERGTAASAAVVAAFRERLAGDHFGDFDEVSKALLDADSRVALVAQETTRGSGSTVTGAVLVSHEGRPHWLIFNVGDSRVYRHVGSQLTQLTVDHSLMQELIDAGQLAPDDVSSFSDRGVITRAIGARDSSADSWLVPVKNGQRLLLCTDGLHSEVNDETIRAVLTMNGRPEAAAKVLIDRANAHGGRDNITVVVIDVLSGGEAPGELRDDTSAPGGGDDDTWDV